MIKRTNNSWTHDRVRYIWKDANWSSSFFGIYHGPNALQLYEKDVEM